MAPLAPAEADGVETSPPVADDVKTTTCYMCACRCGIKVFLRDGQIRYIQGNRDHPVNRGVLCAKGSAGLMQHYSPARLRKPLKRVGPRGEGHFVEIEWTEALDLAAAWLGQIRATDPKKLAFFTGRDQSQSLTGWWAAKFGTPNYAAHGGFCSVNMAAAGIYSIGGSLWEFGEPDWEHTKYLMMFGVAEDHDSNPIKIGIGKIKANGAKFVSVNPARTGYSAVADEWLGIRPGTDGLFVLAIVHELLKAGQIDLDYLARYTNAPWLVIAEPGAPDDGLFLTDAAGNQLLWDRHSQSAVSAYRPDTVPAMKGRYSVSGRNVTPAFQLMAERYLDPNYRPEAVASTCGIPAATIKRIAAELVVAAFDQQIELPIAWTDWAGRKHDRMIGRPVSMHAMRGISAHSNGFQTCRAIHLLQMLLGSIDVPGGFRYKPPFPRPCPPGPKPAGKEGSAPNTPLSGMPLGYVTGPEDLLIDGNGQPLRIDKAFSWESPLSAHGAMHTVITNAAAGDPYSIDTLFVYMGNVAWNSAMNTPAAMAALTATGADGQYKIPHFIYCDAYDSETVAFADLVFPDTTYLERWDCISLLDRPISDGDAAGDAIRQPVVAPDRDVRPFQDVLLELGVKLGLPGMVTADGSPAYPGGYPDYIVNHQRAPGLGPLAGWRGVSGADHGRGPPHEQQLEAYIANGCFGRFEIPQAGRYYKMANATYLAWAQQFGFVDSDKPIVLQLYCEPLQRFRNAARGHGAIKPPDQHRERIETSFDPLPTWTAPLGANHANSAQYPLHAVTQRPMHHYHSWGSQNAWLRQITSENRLFIHRNTAQQRGISDDDWVWIASPAGRVRARVRLVDGVNHDTVWTWNAIAKRPGAWGLATDSPESRRAFLLNHLIEDRLPGSGRLSNSDPITGQAAWFDLKVEVSRCDDQSDHAPTQNFSAQAKAPGTPPPVETLRYGENFKVRAP
ncbi:MAG: formate dehydrogenase [Alphaproteobacteria bacterium]|nr:formate dehydrogenase [Alphaproteobacteria bacterium]